MGKGGCVGIAWERRLGKFYELQVFSNLTEGRNMVHTYVVTCILYFNRNENFAGK